MLSSGAGLRCVQRRPSPATELTDRARARRGPDRRSRRAWTPTQRSPVVTTPRHCPPAAGNAEDRRRQAFGVNPRAGRRRSRTERERLQPPLEPSPTAGRPPFAGSSGPRGKVARDRRPVASREHRDGPRRRAGCRLALHGRARTGLGHAESALRRRRFARPSRSLPNGFGNPPPAVSVASAGGAGASGERQRVRKGESAHRVILRPRPALAIDVQLQRDFPARHADPRACRETGNGPRRALRQVPGRSDGAASTASTHADDRGVQRNRHHARASAGRSAPQRLARSQHRRAQRARLHERVLDGHGTEATASSVAVLAVGFGAAAHREQVTPSGSLLGTATRNGTRCRASLGIRAH